HGRVGAMAILENLALVEMQQNVGRLEIAMHNATLMGIVHGASELQDKLSARQRRLRIAAEKLRKASRVGKFQREVRQAILLADFVNLHDIRMLQARDGLGLALKAGAVFGPGMPASQDHLQRDLTLERELPGAVHNAHAAAAEDAEQFVAGN